MANEIAGANKDALLQWMATGSKTLGWDALVAFDRATVNMAFREQYIRNFSSGQPFPSVNGIDRLEGSNYRALENILLAPPLVSFELSNIVSPDPIVKVTLSIVGGRETKLQYSGSGYVTLTRMNDINLLNSPALTGALNFENVQQEGMVGVISLNLKTGVYELDLGETLWEKTQGGKHFLSHIQTWTDEQTRWIVNKIQRNTGVLAIESVGLRSQRAFPAATRAIEGYGEGAVIAFVKMDGAHTPGFPTKESDLKYLVPNDPGEQYTSTIIVRDVRALLAYCRNSLTHQGGDHKNYLFEPPPSPFAWSVLDREGAGILEINSATINLPGDGGWSVGGYSARFYDVNASLKPGGSTVTLEMEADESDPTNKSKVIKVEVRLVDAWIPVGISRRPGEAAEVSNIKITAGVDARIRVNFNEDTQAITLQHIFHDLTSASAKPFEVQSSMVTWEELMPVAVKQAKSYMTSLAGRMVWAHEPIEFFPLTSLLFEKPFTTVLSSTSSPHDLAMFGHIAPGRLEFQITTPMPMLAAGSEHPFAVAPQTLGVTWAVANVPGEHTPTGSINRLTGQYTAPTANEIQGASVRVLVSAIKGATRASALVTVVRKSLDMDPLIQIASAGSTVLHKVSVGALSDATPVWGAIDPARGSLQDVPGDPRSKFFCAPTMISPGVLVDVVPIKVTVGALTEEVFVAVEHGYPPRQVVAERFDTAARTVQLKSPTSHQYLWKVVKGSASIDQNGLLTADADPQYPFALVTAAYDLGEFGIFWGYVLLGLPLEPFPPQPPEGANAPADSVNLDPLTLLD